MYSLQPELLQRVGVEVGITTGPRLTRRSSRRPRSGSRHWWMVTVAIAASKLSSSNGSALGRRVDRRGQRGGRCARIAAEGSTATDVAVGRFVGARTRADVEHGPRVAERRVDRAAIRGSARRRDA